MPHLVSSDALPKRSYTPESATRALPLLRAIVRDAHESYVDLRASIAAHNEHLRGEHLSGDHVRIADLSSAEDLPESLRDRLATLHEHIGELRELGARLLDPELGIVVVDGEIAGQSAHLCWKLGENSFRYWMPLGSGYDQRRPIPDARPAAQ